MITNKNGFFAMGKFTGSKRRLNNIAKNVQESVVLKVEAKRMARQPYRNTSAKRNVFQQGIGPLVTLYKV